MGISNLNQIQDISAFFFFFTLRLLALFSHHLFLPCLISDLDHIHIIIHLKILYYQHY